MQKGDIKKLTPIQELQFMHEIWTQSSYNPEDVAFRIRAVTLARIESKLYHFGEQTTSQPDTG